MLPAKSRKIYCDFYDAVRAGEDLDPKTTILVALAAAMARECRP